VALMVRRPSLGHKRVAPFQERNPEAEASVKGATRPSSYREHRLANSETSCAFRPENQAFLWEWLIQRIVEPLPVERALARSRHRFTLDARGRSLGTIRVPGATLLWARAGGGSRLPPRPPSLTNRGVANTNRCLIG
jgi:hypothetical protein